MTGNEDFFGQFIDDYFAECDEHLATARRVLLALEDGAASGTPDPALLRELHRSLHTLKGLAGMVGDASAESVAHAVEDALRSAERSARPLVGEAIDAIFVGVDALERCIAARRAGTAAPDVASVLAGLARVLPTAARAPGAKSAPAPAEVAQDDSGGDAVYHFEFSPSLELSDRGVSVDAVRTRLRELGTLLDAKPRMDAGTLIFDFWVSVPEGTSPDVSWIADGIRWNVGAMVAVAPAAAPDAAPADATGRVTGASASVVRVDLSRLDDVMRLVGDLVVSRTRIDDVLRQLSRGDASDARDALEEVNAQMERQIRRLREGVMRIRLVQVGEAFDRLRFAARDAIRESGKRVNLVFHGQTTEIDKQVVDRMLEPLLHVVRNAVIHGIESPDEREAAGKPPEGTLTLRASTAGDRIIIEVSDDGRGIDVDRVAARAREEGILDDDERPSGDRLLDLLCAPGLSTREEADLTSGRGVGMDVVRASVRALSGKLSLDTTPGVGTRFIIELPLTLMIVDALLVDVSGQQMAMPQPSLREVLQVEVAAIVRFENNDVVPYRGAVLPIVRLAQVFALPATERTSAYVLVVGNETAWGAPPSSATEA